MKPPNHLILSVSLWSPWLLYMKEGLENLSACCRGYTWVSHHGDGAVLSMGAETRRRSCRRTSTRLICGKLPVSWPQGVCTGQSSLRPLWHHVLTTTVDLKHKVSASENSLLLSVWQHTTCKYTQHKCFWGTQKNGLRCCHSHMTQILQTCNVSCWLNLQHTGSHKRITILLYLHTQFFYGIYILPCT